MIIFSHPSILDIEKSNLGFPKSRSGDIEAQTMFCKPQVSIETWREQVYPPFPPTQMVSCPSLLYSRILVNFHLESGSQIFADFKPHWAIYDGLFPEAVAAWYAYTVS
jgi:hypothetical protein